MSDEPRDGTDRSPTTASTFRLGRLLYGGILAMMAVDGLQNADERAAYAEAKGVPMPEVSNKAAHGLLLFGGAGVALWKLPRLAALAVASFFVGVTPMMHDFWAADEDEKQQEQINFLKNAALLGTALALFGVASRE
ncbi:DoxX family protein [Haloarcula onubensis]|uniref:DoxX family protein n=1 Tax=Haloarcula onubensis TaxID=2950539 RepID=A0ABU2FN64_9EURY|nr:DoxX family protein [Halomicroarcula sp. S3CR25-11]MDS0282208.1 DoxX family protein [Halomicroarcula sp. S3CR25-11]